MADMHEAMGRPLTQEEKDRCFIMQITGHWGFIQKDQEHKSWEVATLESEGSLHGSQSVDFWNNKKGDPDHWHYVAKVGNPIDWQAVRDCEVGKYVGIVMQPTRKDGKVCAAQFVGHRRYRVYMTIEQAGEVLQRMASGESLLSATENSLEIPLTPLEKKLIAEIMRN